MTTYKIVNISHITLNIDIVGGGAINIQPQDTKYLETLPADILTYYMAGYLYVDPDPLASAPPVGGVEIDEVLVRSTPLTGLATNISTALAASDTILAAFGKLQGQLNANASVDGNKADLVSGVLAAAQRPDASGLAFTPVDTVASNTIQGAIAELGSEKLGTGHEGSGGSVHPTAIPGGAAGFMSGTDKSKLDGIAASATAAGAAGDSYATTHESDTTAHTAANIVNVAAGNIAAVTVQAAINELDTEKLTVNHAGAGGTAHANVVAAGAAGFMTGVDKSKLDGIAASATANSADATLLSRSNHTGTQTASTISDFNSVADTRANARIAASSIDALADVVVTSPSNGQVLKWNGSSWINDTDLNSGVSGTNYRGVVANQAGMLAASTAVRGDYVIRSDRPGLGIWFLKGTTYSTLGDWYELADYLGSVNSEASMLALTPSRDGQYTARSDEGFLPRYWNTGTPTLVTSWIGPQETYSQTDIELLAGVYPVALVTSTMLKARDYEMDLWTPGYAFAVAATSYTSISGVYNAGQLRLSASGGTSSLSVSPTKRCFLSFSSQPQFNGFYQLTGVSGAGPFLLDFAFAVADQTAVNNLGTISIATTASEVVLRSTIIKGGFPGAAGCLRGAMHFNSTGSATKTFKYHIASGTSAVANNLLTGGTMMSQGQFTSGVSNSGEMVIQNVNSNSNQIGFHMNNLSTPAATTGTVVTNADYLLVLTVTIGTANDAITPMHLIKAHYKE